MQIRVVTAVLLLFVMVIPAPAGAEWIDDWIDQSTYSGPNNFEAQKRGYAALGGGNLRWRTSTEPLLTISPPRMKIGCGGIDLSLGSFGYLKFEQLVEKFQRIMGPAAAAFAFDIALNTLNSQASNTIKSLTSIVDRFNQLQLDDCKASKAVAVTLMQPFSSNLGQKDVTEAWSEFYTSTGLGDTWKEMTDDSAGQTLAQAASTNGTNVSAMTSGCPALMKAIFFEDGYLLDNVGNSLKYATDYIKLMRGMVGDVLIDKPAGTFVPELPCPQNGGNTLKDWAEGHIWYRDQNGVCQKITSFTVNGSTYSSYRDYISDALQQIIQNVIDKAPLTADQEALVKRIPLPVYNVIMIQIRIMGKNANPVIIANSIDSYVAQNEIYSMLTDFYLQMTKALREAENVAAAQNGGDVNTCKEVLAKSAMMQISQMLNQLGDNIKKLRDDYAQVNKEVSNTLQIQLANLQIKEKLNKETANKNLDPKKE